MALEEWEHKVVTLTAVAAGWRAGEPKYPPQALVPQLDAYGRQGWELVSAQPVFMGENGDITYHEAGWTYRYLCFFKRRRQVES